MLEKIKIDFANKSIGYYFSAVITLLSLVTAIVYAATYAGTAYISWMAFVLLLVLFVVNVALFLLAQLEWTTLSSVVLATIAVCFFAYGIYFYVSIVMVGIDLQTFDNNFIINAILFVLLLSLSISNVFLKKLK